MLKAVALVKEDYRKSGLALKKYLREREGCYIVHENIPHVGKLPVNWIGLNIGSYDRALPHQLGSRTFKTIKNALETNGRIYWKEKGRKIIEFSQKKGSLEYYLVNENTTSLLIGLELTGNLSRAFSHFRKLLSQQICD